VSTWTLLLILTLAVAALYVAVGFWRAENAKHAPYIEAPATCPIDEEFRLLVETYREAL
jgi:hypothetical protein